MSSKKAKHYVVWVGRETGIYPTWEACCRQVKGHPGARYKAYDTRSEAEAAFAAPPPTPQPRQKKAETPHTAEPPQAEVRAAWAVDAACSGNPGQMEYQGVEIGSGKRVFHFGPVYGTNNIGEFLAIVHALALLEQQGLKRTVYSDSRNALLWVKARKCRTKLPRGPKTEELFQLIARAERWLQTHTVTTPLLKWDTAHWGEIPADFGRK